MDQYLDQLLATVSSVQSYFYDKRVEELIKEYLGKVKSPVHATVSGTILNNGTCPLLIIATNPKEVFHEIISQVRKSEIAKPLFRPITIITKLANSEFIFDVNGDSLIYAISAGSSNEALVNSLTCRYMYTIKNFFNLVDDSGKMTDDAMQAFSQLVGGKKNKKRSKPKQSARINVKLDMLTKLMVFVQSNTMLMKSTIYLNTLEDVDNHALDIIYTDLRSRQLIIDYLRAQVNTADYTFGFNSHTNYYVPYDFRLRKFSCFIKNNRSGQTSYLVNLYNSASYEPIPCYNIGTLASSCQLQAHPLVMLRFLYLDLHFLHSKTDKNKSVDGAFENRMEAMQQATLSHLKNIHKIPTWIGIYKDEVYDRNQENMRQVVEMPFETILV